MTPGVAPDPRGVLLGRTGLLVFPSIDGVVSWLRVYSAESTMDELFPSFAITHVRTKLRTSEMAVKIPATSSHVMDRAARCARLVGGATFTGTTKHYVKYRDDRSPYGYDAVEIQALPDDVDFMVHGEDYVQSYQNVGDLAFDRLLFRLSLRKNPADSFIEDDDRRELMFVVAPGLADGVIRYLWRNKVRAGVVCTRPKRDSAFDELGSRPLVIIRAEAVHRRVIDLFRGTPGVDVFRLATPNVAVQAGYQHSITLSSCASLFDKRHVYLFWGDSDRVDVVDGPFQFADLANLTRIQFDLDGPDRGINVLKVKESEEVGVPLHLAASFSSPRRVTATLVPMGQAEAIKKLVYVLPPVVLQSHRIAVTDRGVLCVTSGETDVLPLGQLLSELAPGLLVPVGLDLVPRVSPEVLAQALGHNSGVVTVFPQDGRPFQISETAFVTLERKAVAGIEVSRAETIDVQIEKMATPEVVNKSIGRFSLWGFRRPPK